VKFIAFCILYLSCNTLISSQEIHVGFEPFPPVINHDGSGLAVDMLNALSENTGLEFNFQLMTYARAKKELKSNRIDLIGLTPKDNETAEFYQFAKELNWSIDTTVDLFSTSIKQLELSDLPDRAIGTLIGNADFFSEQTQLSKEKFIEVSSLDQLVQMMLKGRITVVIFERASMMSTIKKLKISNIYYKKFAVMPASLAVAKHDKGLALKTKLDEVLNLIDIKHIFSNFHRYSNMDDEGVVQIQE